MDEILQQANQNTTVPSTSQGSHSSNHGHNTAPLLTPGASSSAPVKTEAAKNIIQLTPEERDCLWKIATCFQCVTFRPLLVFLFLVLLLVTLVFSVSLCPRVTILLLF